MECSAELNIKSSQNTNSLILSDYLIYLLTNLSHEIGQIILPVLTPEYCLRFEVRKYL